MNRLLLPVLTLALVACGDQVDTAYGSASRNGLNGFALVEDHWRETLDLTCLHRWGSLAEDCQTVIWLEDGRSGSLLDLEAATAESLRRWLRRGDRQLVLVLRDGVFSDWLLRRWLAALEQRLSEADEAGRRLLEERIAEYRAALEEPPPRLEPGEPAAVLSCELTGIRPPDPGPMAGLATGAAPVGMRLRVAVTDRRARPLVTFGGHVWAAEIACYGSSRLVVVTNALPLFNAALVDPQARALVEALTADLDRHRQGRAALVADLRPLPPHPPPGILSTLFLTPPYAVVSWHVLLLLLLYAWYRASAWLGRTEDDPEAHLHDFGAHLDALGRRLQRVADPRQALATIAAALDAQTPTPSDDPLDDARRLIDGQGGEPASTAARTPP